MTGELLLRYISTYLLVWYPSKMCQADDSNSPGTVGTSQVSSHLLVGTYYCTVGRKRVKSNESSRVKRSLNVLAFTELLNALRDQKSFFLTV